MGGIRAMNAERPALFCFGLGFTATALARVLSTQGWSISGTSRDSDRCARLAACGYAMVPFDRAHPVVDLAARLRTVTHLLISIPPDGAGDPAIDCHRDTILAAGSIRWVGYLSTTGVYGDTAGAWVDETAVLRPTSERSIHRVAAEVAWLDLWRRYDLPIHVFRLAGIYGSGRSAIDQARVGAARRIDKPGHVFSRIHVDDAARTVAASIERLSPGAIYNVCDDEPAPQEAVVAYACRLLGLPPPPLVSLAEAALSSLARSFYVDNRRVRNDRIKRELGVVLGYPTYREGLAAIVRS